MAKYKGPGSYKEAGVDIVTYEKAIGGLIGNLKFCRKGSGQAIPLKDGFAGLVRFGDHGIALCTDGVGSKMLVAEAMDRYDTVGIDCMAMNVNDLICIGAEPLAFVDYLAMHGPDERVAREIGVGLNRGAELANVSIVGGETAELPDMVNGYDLAGTAMGVVKLSKLIDGAKVKPGDLLIGIPSSGLHSNGYTLARKIIAGAGIDYHDKEPSLKGKVGDAMLVPTEIYVRPALKALARHDIHGLAHITGAGLENLLRFKSGAGFDITDPMPVPRIFSYLQELSGIGDWEFHRTFNMGMGLALAVKPDDADGVMKTLMASKLKPKVVGHAVKGARVRHGEMVFK